MRIKPAIAAAAALLVALPTYAGGNGEELTDEFGEELAPGLSIWDRLNPDGGFGDTSQDDTNNPFSDLFNRGNDDGSGAGHGTGGCGDGDHGDGGGPVQQQGERRGRGPGGNRDGSEPGRLGGSLGECRYHLRHELHTDGDGG